MSIIIGADLVPTESNYDLFSNGSVEKLVGAESLKKLNKAEYSIFNFEIPLIDKRTYIKKYGAVEEKSKVSEKQTAIENFIEYKRHRNLLYGLKGREWQ